MRPPKLSKAAPVAVDTISTLPDEILSRILSLIPTKEAVATSILSKRWTNLWQSVDSIDFPYVEVETIESNHSFNEFVDSVLASRDAAGSHFINSFRLKIEYNDPSLAYNLGFPNITKWLNLVSQRRLKYLCLHLHVFYHAYDYIFYANPPKLPVSILTCKTLVNLDLYRFRVEGFSSSSIGFGFPSLQILHLKHIYFHEVRDLMLLLTGCPNLQYLRVSNIYFHSKEDPLTIHQEFKSLILSKLTSADIAECSSYFPLKVLSNSKYLCIETSKLYTEGHKVYEVNQPQHPCDDIPIFHNLTHLELHDTWDLVARVLQHCPKLQSLKLYQESYEAIENEEGDRENWVDLEFVPECLLSSLRTCTIRDFLGLQSELVLVKYILENAKKLQTMIIWSISEPPEIQRKLSACLKASATCQLSVYIDNNI